jgi:hypothetical protein
VAEPLIHMVLGTLKALVLTEKDLRYLKESVGVTLA